MLVEVDQNIKHRITISHASCSCIDANPSWTSAQLEGALPSSTTRIAGITWDVYDRRDADDPGNLAYALVATVERSTFVLAGTASDEEFETLAGAVAAEVDS